MSPILGVLASAQQGALAGGDFESIATITSGSDFAAFDFQNIPQTYQHLELRFMTQSTLASTVDNLAFYANNDTSAVYSTHSVYGNGSSALAYSLASGVRMYLPSLVSAATTAQFTVGVVQILDYASTNKNTTIRTLHGFDANGSGIVGLTSGAYLSTSAITRFSGGTSANLKAGSTFALYGIK